MGGVLYGLRKNWATWSGQIGSWLASLFLLWPPSLANSSHSEPQRTPHACVYDLVHPTDLSAEQALDTPWDRLLQEMGNCIDGQAAIGLRPPETHMMQLSPLSGGPSQCDGHDSAAKLDLIDDETQAPPIASDHPLTGWAFAFDSVPEESDETPDPEKEVLEDFEFLDELDELVDLEGFGEEIFGIKDENYREHLIQLGRALRGYVRSNRFYIPGSGWLYRDWRKRRVRFIAPYLALKLSQRHPDFLEYTETRQVTLIRELIQELSSTLRVSGISLTLLTVYGLAGGLTTVVNRITNDVGVLPALMAAFVTVVTGAATVFYVRQYVVTGIQRMLSSKVRHQSSDELDGETTELLTQVRDYFERFQEEEAVVHAAPIMAQLLIKIGHNRRIDPVELVGSFRRLFVEQHIRSSRTYRTFMEATLKQITRSPDRDQEVAYYMEMLQILLHPPLRGSQGFPVEKAIKKLVDPKQRESTGSE